MKKQELITIIKTVRQELKESLPKMIKEITKLHEQRTPSTQESDPVKLAEVPCVIQIKAVRWLSVIKKINQKLHLPKTKH